MKFYSVLLVLLLAWSSVTQETYVGFVGNEPTLNSTALGCLAASYQLSDQKYPYTIIRIYQNSVSPAGVDPNAANSITNAINAGF